MEIPANAGARLKETRKKLGLSVKDFADGAGLRDYKVRDCELGKQRIDDEMLSALAYSYKINLNWLITGEDGLSINVPNNAVLLNFYPDVTAAAGYGAINADTRSQPYMLDKSFLLELGITRFKNLDLIRICGDSMEPFISNGEFVIVDRDCEVKNGTVIVANICGDLYIKRLSRDPFGKWIHLISDNPDYEPIKLTNEKEIGELKIIGVVRAKIKPF